MDALGDFFPITADGSTTWTLMQNRSLRNEIRFFKENAKFLASFGGTLPGKNDSLTQKME